MSKNRNYIFIAVAVIFICVCGLVGWIVATFSGDNREPTQNTENVTSIGETVTDVGNALDSYKEESDMGSTVIIDGQTYRLNKKLKTVLFMGVDSKESVEAADVLGNGGRADTIMLFILNEENRTMKVLEISRDSMVIVDAYNHDRELLYSGKMQINMQYAFSDSHARSCTLMKRKVSDLLYGINVNSSISVTMDGIPAAADALGGLEVTMDRDWTEIQDNYTSGTTVHMNGEEAERFIRYRDGTQLGSNDTRMERHSYLLTQMFNQVKKLSVSELSDLLNTIDPYMETDMDGETIKKLATYQMEEVLKVPGSTVAGKNHDEFYIDEDALQKMILELFYVPADY